MITIVVKEPGKTPETREIKNTLDAMQAVVAHGDFRLIELISDGPLGLDLWANAEAKYAQDANGGYLQPNLLIYKGLDFVLGTAFVAASTDEGDTRGLNPEEIEWAHAWLELRSLSETGAARTEEIAEMYR